VMVVLGRDEVQGRLRDAAEGRDLAAQQAD
jgi:hypothetical protein